MDIICSKNKLKEKKENKLLQIFVCFYFFFCFFEQYLNGILGSVGKYYIFFLAFLVVLYYQKFKIKTYHFFFCAWFIYKIITVLWTPNAHVFQLHFLSHVGMTLLFLVMTTVEWDKQTIRGIIYTTMLSSFAIGFLSIFYGRPYHGTVENRLVLNIMGQEMDPNNQAAFLLFGICIALYFLICLKKHIVFDIIIIAINAFSLFRTSSRGGFVSLLFLILIIAVVPTKKFNFRSTILKLFMVAFIVAALYFIAVKYLPQGMYSRLFGVAGYEDGSDRLEIWGRAFSLLNENLNWIFGGGWGSLYGYGEGYTAGHNTYISMLCDVGILGSLLFFAPIMVVAIYFVKRKQLLPLLVLVAGLAPCFFLDAINKRYFWNPIIIAFVCSNSMRAFPFPSEGEAT